MTRRRAFGAAAALVGAAGWIAAALALWRTSVPGLDLDGLDARRYFAEAELERTADYERFLHIDFALADLVLLVVLALYAWRGAAFMRESAAGRIGTGMLLGMLGFALVWLAQVPFQVAALWWDRRHDVTDMGYVELLLGNWLLLGAQFLSLCFALLVVMGLAGVLREWWWVAAAPVFVAIGLLFIFVFPYVGAMGEVTEVEDPQLARVAERLARQQGVEDVEVRIEHVSEWTDAPNAYAAGLGPTRKVFLWDTLVDGFDEDEVEVVLAHEFAHHSRDHLWKAAGFFALLAFPGAFLIARATRRRGGMQAPEAVPLGLFVFVLLQLVAQPVFNEHSRRQEAEADWVALESTRDPEATEDLFEGFTDHTLEQPNPPTWAYVWQSTHPSIMERIAMAEAWRERRG